MNILVVNGYVRQNKGDAALMSVICHELRESFPHANIKISSQENPQQDPTFEDWRNVGSFNRYCFDPSTGKLNHLLRLLLCIAVIQCLPFVPKARRGSVVNLLPAALRPQLRALTQTDLVVAMGGGYLNGNTSWMANVCVYLMLAPLKMAKRFGACAVCAPQSMGPFATRFQRLIVRNTLEKIDLILAREQKTLALLHELSPRFPIKQSVDSGFLFANKHTANLRSKLGMGPKDLLVGITVRRWLDSNRQFKYEKAIAQTIDYLVTTHKATVVLIPQVTSSLGGDDDRLTSAKVYAKVKRKQHVHVLQQDYTHQQIKSLYNALDIIIGTRFHSVIFSLTSRVPAIAIEYEHKTSGIMHDLGLDNWVVKIEEATAQVLRPKIDELIGARAEYKQQLGRILPPYIAQAKKASTLIKQAYHAGSTRTE